MRVTLSYLGANVMLSFKLSRENIKHGPVTFWFSTEFDFQCKRAIVYIKKKYNILEKCMTERSSNILHSIKVTPSIFCYTLISLNNDTCM